MIRYWMLLKQKRLLFVLIAAGIVCSALKLLSGTPFYKENNRQSNSFVRHKNLSIVDDVNTEYHTDKAVLGNTSLRRPGKPLILYWGFPWNLNKYVPPEGDLEECEVTYSRSRLHEANAIIFHFTNIKTSMLPWKHYRDPDQVFVWWCQENPAVLQLWKDIQPYPDFFNWTWTYQRRSEVWIPYGNRYDVITRLQRGKKAVDDIIADKRKLAIWCVNQCDYTNGAKMRMKLALDLRKAGLNFDGCGKCFPGEVKIKREDSNQILFNAVKKYKFYFAFENGLHCKDYITEKFWENSLISGAVPIVWGPMKNDILAVAPLDSFVFAEDFESPAKLAEYINYLDSNETEYRKYFRWREDESMTDEKMMKMTKERYPDLDVLERPKSLCERLVENKERKTIKSLSRYFMDGNPKECS